MQYRRLGYSGLSAWLLQRPVMAAPIIGANSVQQLNDSLGSLNVQLTPDDVTAIDEASRWK